MSAPAPARSPNDPHNDPPTDPAPPAQERMDGRLVRAVPSEMQGETPAPVSLRTLVLIRWGAIVGQLAAVLVVHYGFGYALPIVAALLVIASSVVLNVAVLLFGPTVPRVSDRDAAFMLGYDIIQLTALLYLTGGIENPFVFLVIAPVVISASILSRWITGALMVLAILCMTFIAFFHERLPLPDELGFSVPSVYLLGLWTAVCISAAFIAVYVGRVAEEGRRISDALAVTQMALSREQRRSAVGALAAAAAHELGSPLATIAVVANELKDDLPAEGPLREDITLLLSQTDRCRQILTALSTRPMDSTTGADTTFDRLPLCTLLNDIAQAHDGDAVLVDVVREDSETDEPIAANSAELRQGLGTLIENAVQFAHSTVTLTARWTPDAVTVVVADDGPGFAPSILGRLGEPYVSSRRATHRGGRRVGTGHMGLGVFIAETLLARTGAELTYGNVPRELGSGAAVTITWSPEQLSMSTAGGPASAPPSATPDGGSLK